MDKRRHERTSDKQQKPISGTDSVCNGSGPVSQAVSRPIPPVAARYADRSMSSLASTITLITPSTPTTPMPGVTIRTNTRKKACLAGVSMTAYADAVSYPPRR